MIGDRRDDVVGALKNEVFPIGVLWGFGPPEELISAGATRLVERPLDLAQLNAS